MKKILKKYLDDDHINNLKSVYSTLNRLLQKAMYPYGRFFRTPLRLKKNARKKDRKLEIGPGPQRVPGFETLNVVWGADVDYVLNASKKLPFPSGSFNLIYASHVLEHIPWYQVQEVVNEWTRILSPGGTIEIWVPDGYKIAKNLIKFEEDGEDYSHLDGWYRLNPKKNPHIWASARIFSYGDGSGKINDPNWHRTLLTPKLLEDLLSGSGLINIKTLETHEVRGHDHGWINLGMIGTKP